MLRPVPAGAAIYTAAVSPNRKRLAVHWHPPAGFTGVYDASGKEQARLRGQALGWLREDLAAWTKLAAGGKPDAKARITNAMNEWRMDDDFVGVRDKEALEKLPDDERRDWQKLWADVDALLKKTESK